MVSTDHPVDVDFINGQLIAKRENLISRQKSGLEALQSGSDARKNCQDDTGGIPEVNYEKDFHESISNSDTATLKDIKDALERLHGGEFGLCEDCEEPIAPGRLRAIPWARRCVSCQECHEQQGGFEKDSSLLEDDDVADE